MRYSRHPMWWVAVPTSRGGTATHPIGKWLYPTRDLLYQTAEWVPTTLLSDHLTTIPHLNQLIAPGAAAASLANALGSSLASSPPSPSTPLIPPPSIVSRSHFPLVPYAFLALVHGPPDVLFHRLSYISIAAAQPSISIHSTQPHQRERMRVISGFSALPRSSRSSPPPPHRSIAPDLIRLRSVPDSLLPSASLNGNAAAVAALSLASP
ncbi:hypothetical protein CONPUDRAFT_160309 [Coniophora puteana RWD-64-598 SS2]|uniref:Uncharacterized protein n=1 Tax=Coniophora puteana (strain RWD-64-598) TaxID=741705 RepID=R7SDN0_CONPW|nr:uncharacterized protein CONPUDRAFT_160309 [Coniophora puteana RWD-64-598 SS2]EIW74266.1 hypothetical protein CONPUDRAFT_160309 [Coniophora puteana RWD-64-598 SS2]